MVAGEVNAVDGVRGLERLVLGDMRSCVLECGLEIAGLGDGD